MDEELTMLQDSVARFAQRELVPHVARWNVERRVDREAWLKAGEAGILCPSIPAEYGGGGGDRRHDAVVAAELGRAGVGGGFGTGVGVSCSLVAHYILRYGTEAQKEAWLPGMASGAIIGAVAMTEPGAGSDLQGIRTTARRDGDAYVITGQKTFISNGQNCDLVVVAAKTGTGGAKDVSLIVVEPEKAPGFRRGRNLDKVGMHAQDTSELFFDEVRVPVGNLLGGDEGRGFVQLMQELAWERLSCALGAVTSMERAVEVTTDYVKQRNAFGKPLMAFQNTQFRLAECKTKAVIARSFTDDLMMKLMEGTLDPVTAAMAKWWTTQSLTEVADECLQLHGGYGYMNEYPIAQIWADARVTKIFAGTNEIMKMLIARSL
ncbi:Acyl-CoA dehydrogenase [Alphaproteobacteria bacterium SO-S41]|nr:Acyl-CoA dehydrogenase [Alphaproteobacteria bacterium SO-S41]